MKRKILAFVLFIVILTPVSAIAAGEHLTPEKRAQVVKGLLKKLYNKNPDIRYKAAQKLAPYRAPESYKHLMRLGIKEKVPRVRRAAIYALGILGDKKAASFLLSAIKKKELMPVAAMALGRIGDPRAIRPLIANLKKWDGCVLALQKIGDPAVGPLIGALKSKNDRTRMLAARTLGKIGDRRALSPLKKARNDKNKWVKTEVEKAIKTFE